MVTGSNVLFYTDNYCVLSHNKGQNGNIVIEIWQGRKNITLPSFLCQYFCDSILYHLTYKMFQEKTQHLNSAAIVCGRQKVRPVLGVSSNTIIT